MASTSKNHEKAPKCAAFVESMRSVFGADQIKVLYVKEGSFQLGELSWVPRGGELAGNSAERQDGMPGMP